MFQILLQILITSHIVTSQSPVILLSPQNVSVCEGETANFSCLVMWPDGLTPGGATWFTNNGNNDASTEPGLIITNDYDGRLAPTNITNILIVTNVSSSNNGSDYVCVQGLNERSAAVYLTVFDLPPTPTITSVQPLTSTSFTINWTSSDPNYNYTVIWTNLHTGVMYNRTVPGNTNSYTVTGLSGDVNYNVSVAAVNRCGMNTSDPVTVYVPPDEPGVSYCISYGDGQPILQVSTHVIVDVPKMSLMLKFLTSYHTGATTVMDAICNDVQSDNNTLYNCTAEFTIGISESVNVTVIGPYGSNFSVMEVDQRSNAILNVNVKNASHNLTIVKCELACFSSKLECVLYNITTNNIDVTSLIMNTTGNITGPLTSYNYPTQQITLTNLTSGTTYNYCVVGINVTNMMEVGDPVCGNFTTKNLTSTFTGDDDSCSECYGTVSGIAAGIISVVVVILILIVLVWCITCRNKTCRPSNSTCEEFFDQFVVIGSLVVGVCIIVAVIVVAMCYCVCCKNGDDHFECQECYGAAIAGVVVIVTMIIVGICCCISLSGEYCLCCHSCCNQDEKEKEVYGTKRRVAVEPHIENIDLDTTRYAHIIENPTANQTNVQIFVSDNKSKPQPTGQTHLNRSVEDYEASIVIENPLTEPPESLIPHNTTDGVQYAVSTKLKSTMQQIQRDDGVTIEDNTEASSQPEVENATDGDDSEDTTISHPQPDPDTAQQGSTNKEHSTPNDYKQQDEVDSSDRWNEENTNTGSPKIPVTTATHQLTNTSATSSQSGPSSEYAVIQKPTNKKVPHLTVISGDRYALSTHVNSLKRVKHDNDHKQQDEADGTDRRNEENTNAGSPNIPVTTATHQLANTSVTSSQSGPSSEYAVIQKPTNKKIPHLTVNSGDKYALSTHVNSLKRVKQQQPTSVHSQVGHSNQKGSAAAGNDNQPH
ncbi:uncharacterized protein [Dysidea avara]|uniref:uncharacterized protein isoform X2 n=1 Tax=Dysidea avara TaxID=196820 RepID=UPI00331D8EC8